MSVPKLITGSTYADDRGILTFNNDLSLSGTKRSYFMSGDKGMIRAWHGHKIESKVIQCVSGRVRIYAVNMDAYEKDPISDINRFYLIPNGNAVYIPKVYYNGIQFLSDNSSIIVYSDTTVEESKADDYRLNWNACGVGIWNMEDYR